MAMSLRTASDPGSSGRRLGGLAVDGLSKSFDDRVIFTSVGLQAHRGEPTMLIGPNGSGKTTLLDILAGETSGEQGVVHFDDSLIGEVARESIRFIHQSATLLPDLTVTETCQLWATLFDEQERAHSLVHKFGLSMVADDLVKQLSGGEQQRLRLALSTVGTAEMYLFDEPTNNLDADGRGLVCQMVRELADQEAVVIVATHDIELLAEVAGPVLMMLNGGLTQVRSESSPPAWMEIGDKAIEVSDFASLEQVFEMGRN